MERFAQTAQRIASTPGKLEKIAVLASYFRSLDDADLIAAARFFTGNPFAARDRRTLSIGGRTIVEVARRVWGFDDAALGSSYRATGDLGAALGPLVRPPVDAMLFSDRLTPAMLDVLFGEIAQASGKRANRQARGGTRAHPARLRRFVGRDLRRQDHHRGFARRITRRARARCNRGGLRRRCRLQFAEA